MTKIPNRPETQFPKPFITLSSAARFLKRMSPEKSAKLKVRLHDNTERPAQTVIEQWAYIQQNLDKEVGAEWTKLASVVELAEERQVTS